MEYLQRISKIETITVIIIISVILFFYWNPMDAIEEKAKERGVIILASKLGSVALTNMVSRKTNRENGVKINNCIDYAKVIDLPNEYRISSIPLSSPNAATCTVHRRDDANISHIFTGYAVN